MKNWEKYLIILALLCTIIVIFSSSSFAANKTILIVENNVSKYSDPYFVSIELTDLEGNPLGGEKLEVNIDGWDFGNLTTDGGGQILIEFETSMEGTWYNHGKYLVTAKYYGSSKYEPNYAEGYIIVKSMPTSLNLKYKETNNKQLAVVTLKDVYGKAADACRVNLYVDGKFYTYVITNEKGVATFDLSKLSPGKHLIVARNSNIGKNYIPDEKNMTVNIKKNKNNDISQNNQYGLAKASTAMKNSGIPIIALLLTLITIGAIFKRSKK
jgi:hypothetical protein